MAHCNTIFHQMLKLIPRHHFAKLENEHGTGRKARSFTRWSQFVHLLSMQLTARDVPSDQTWRDRWRLPPLGPAETHQEAALSFR